MIQISKESPVASANNWEQEKKRIGIPSAYRFNLDFPLPSADSMRSFTNAPTGYQGLSKRFQVQDIVSGMLYDRIKIPPATQLKTRSEFFVDVGAASRKTLEDSNLSMPSKLPLPEEFIVKRVSVMVKKGTSEKDLQSLAEHCYWELYVGQKVYARCPFFFDGPRVGEMEDLANPIGATDVTLPASMQGAISEAAGGDPSDPFGEITNGLWIVDGLSFFGQIYCSRPFVSDPNGIGIQVMMGLSGIYIRGIC